MSTTVKFLMIYMSLLLYWHIVIVAVLYGCCGLYDSMNSISFKISQFYMQTEQYMNSKSNTFESASDKFGTVIAKKFSSKTCRKWRLWPVIFIFSLKYIYQLYYRCVFYYIPGLFHLPILSCDFPRWLPVNVAPAFLRPDFNLLPAIATPRTCFFKELDFWLPSTTEDSLGLLGSTDEDTHVGNVILPRPSYKWHITYPMIIFGMIP